MQQKLIASEKGWKVSLSKLLSSLAFALLVQLVMCIAAPARAAIPIVAAENFYGEVAMQVGGEDVHVTSILANPDQDPHLFEVSPSVARAISAAQIVIYNGLDYDPWMERLLAATSAPRRQTIAVASLIGSKSGDNPHIWYLPETMFRLAETVSAYCTDRDPDHASAYARRLARFQASLTPISARIASMRRRLQGMPVTATEPVFGAMFTALGMVARDQGFQRAVMNGTEAGASDVVAFEADLRLHRVKLLVFNNQASDAVAERMKTIAAEVGVPTLGMTETEPSGLGYQEWITAELDLLDRAVPK